MRPKTSEFYCKNMLTKHADKTIFISNPLKIKNLPNFYKMSAVSSLSAICQHIKSLKIKYLYIIADMLTRIGTIEEFLDEILLRIYNIYIRFFSYLLIHRVRASARAHG